jgi:beta-galactosidase
MAEHARRPIVTTEYSHALAEGGFGGLEDRWRALTKHPAGAGGMIWLWADQGIRRKVRGRPVLDPLADLARYHLQGSELVRTSIAGEDEIFDSHGIFGTDGIVNADRTPQHDYLETKAVYAPVAIPVSELPFKLGQSSIAVPVRNDFDFIDLDSITIHWRLFIDEREVAAGDARLKVPPHETGPLEIPTRAIQDIKPGSVYYVHLIFLRPDGSEITRRSVRLVTDAATVVSGVGTASRTRTSPTTRQRPRASKSGAQIIVNAGAMRYVFDSRTGFLVAASSGGRPLITGSRLAVWRPLSLSELPLPPDLDRYTSLGGRCEIVEGNDELRIRIADVVHRVDDRNSFSASYEYRIDRDGELRVEYSIKPKVEIKWLPEIGIELETPADLNLLRWVGLGPIDAYPNERAAAMFGFWSGRAGTDQATGTKAEVQWAELTDARGSGFRAAGSPFVCFKATEKQPGRLRLLTAVVGRSTKFNPPERSSYRLDVSGSAAITGRFTLSVWQ